MNQRRTDLSRISAWGVSRGSRNLEFVLMAVISLLCASCLGMASEPKSLVQPYYVVGGGGDYYNLMERGGHLMLVLSPIDIKEFFPVGIWRSVRLEVVPRIHLERPYLVTEEATAEKARVAVDSSPATGPG
jgi:hypothetical protein